MSIPRQCMHFGLIVWLSIQRPKVPSEPVSEKYIINRSSGKGLTPACVKGWLDELPASLFEADQ